MLLVFYDLEQFEIYVRVKYGFSQVKNQLT
jgi:hypothetical protein